MDVGHATLAAGYDPLDMAKRAVDGRSFISVMNQYLLQFSLTSRISMPRGKMTHVAGTGFLVDLFYLVR